MGHGTDGLIYLAGPITAKHGYTVEQNEASAAAIYFQLVKAGIPAFCPQLGAAYAIERGPDYEAWMRFDFRIIDLSSGVLMLPRWETSDGAVREYERSIKIGKPVYFSVDVILAEALQSR